MTIPPEELITVGFISKPHGLQGEVLVSVAGPLEELINESVEFQLVSPQGTAQAVRVARYRDSGNKFLVVLEGYPDRTAVETLRGYELRVSATELPPLAEGEFYEYQLKGCRVVTESGECLGTLDEILVTGANDVWVVRDPTGKEVLLPATNEVFVSFHNNPATLVVTLPEGLLSAQEVTSHAV